MIEKSTLLNMWALLTKIEHLFKKKTSKLTLEIGLKKHNNYESAYWLHFGFRHIDKVHRDKIKVPDPVVKDLISKKIVKHII